jgi:hypothetical protein
MSYNLVGVSVTPILADVIKAGTPTSAAVNGRFSLSGTINGSASIVSDRLRLPTGSSYYLEGSVLIQQTALNGAITWQWYDNTNSTYIGSEGFMNLATSFGSVGRISRRVACALVLDSDITSSVDVELRIKSLTGTSWNLTITSSGIGAFDFVGYPSARILEIPT